MDDMLRNGWRALRMSLNDKPMTDIPSTRSKTVQERLVARYRRFEMLEVVLLVLMPCCLCKLEIEPVVWKWVIIGMYELLMLSCLFVDHWLAGCMQMIDVENMPVVDVIQRCALARKRHLQFVIYCFPFALLTVVLMVYAMSSDKAVVIGACAGGLLGLIIGLLQLREFLRDYRSLMSLD